VAVAKGIFDHAVDQDEVAESKYADDLVGTFRTGHQDARGNPRSLTEWRATSGDPDVIDAVAATLGGTPQEWDNDKEPIEVFTEAQTITVVLEPGAIRSGYAFWGRNALISRCDGAVITYSGDDGDAVGDACSCAGKTIEERRKSAKNGTGCKPDVSIVFALADQPNLGKFRFRSGSEILLRDIQEVEEKVAASEEPVRATMTLEQVTTKAGKTFTKTVVALEAPKKPGRARKATS
jgi:hypothetical protein